MSASANDGQPSGVYVPWVSRDGSSLRGQFLTLCTPRSTLHVCSWMTDDFVASNLFHPHFFCPTYVGGDLQTCDPVSIPRPLARRIGYGETRPASLSSDLGPPSGGRLCIKEAGRELRDENANSMDPQSAHYYSTGRTTPTPRRRIPQPPPPNPYEEILSLDFICKRKSRCFLNCTIVGRDGFTPYFHIMTGSEVRSGSTFIRTNDGRTVATIDWGGKGGEAYVEVCNLVLKQRVSKWLAVSADASYRLMHAFGQQYVWVPQSHSICMYQWNPTAVGDVPQLLARIEKDDRTLTLEITIEAMNRGLLEMAVVAATVFQSGCRID
ncbi:hypothetical protein B0H19DRAFT_1129936 [Mycena capillaripes]|nr:hypothetical protein B0H19DRAFT_1129936 [Mycena capillaripes]